MDDWGERLQQALRLRRVGKLYALAVDLGVDESAISRWKKGGPISLRNAVELSRVLDVSLDWLVTGRGAIEAHRAAEAAGLEALLMGLPPAEAARLRQLLLAVVESLGPIER